MFGVVHAVARRRTVSWHSGTRGRPRLSCSVRKTRLAPRVPRPPVQPAQPQAAPHPIGTRGRPRLSCSVRDNAACAACPSATRPRRRDRGQAHSHAAPPEPIPNARVQSLFFAIGIPNYAGCLGERRQPLHHPSRRIDRCCNPVVSRPHDPARILRRAHPHDEQVLLPGGSAPPEISVVR